MNPYEINAKLERWINRGLRVGKMFGIEVVIHPFLMLLFVYWLAIAVIPPGPEQLVSANFYTYSIFETLVFIAVVFGSVLLHEFG
ncbi:hypothetical protein HYR69_07325, partial [Candidatus Sumerlaeota bacterium]|nr:hypothetical protein [Candidatus Sumerlaeota bacterium]